MKCGPEFLLEAAARMADHKSPALAFAQAAYIFPMLIAFFRLAAVAALAVSSTACSWSPSGDKVRGWLTPYRVEVVQGNVVTKEMLAQIQPGLGRMQVREILGSPLLTDVFHADRWDYVFTIRRRGTDSQQRHFAVYFKDDRVERFDALELPSEREFVVSIAVGGERKVPKLELTAEQIQALPLPKPVAEATSAPVSGLARDYPPLEP